MGDAVKLTFEAKVQHTKWKAKLVLNELARLTRERPHDARGT